MKPKLRPGHYFIPTPDGVCFLGPGHTVTLKGPTIYSWVERLALHLDGHRTLAELTAGLGDDRRAMVERIVAALHGSDLLTDAGDELPSTLSAEDLVRFAEQIAFVDAAVGSGAHFFERWRTCQAVAIGAGKAFGGLVAMLAESGIGGIRVAVTSEADTDMTQLALLAEESRGTVLQIRRGLDEPSQLLGSDPPGLVLHLSDRPMLARALRLDRLVTRLRIPLVQGVIVDAEAWIGPIGGVMPADRGWETGWRRLLDRMPTGPAGRFTDRPEALTSIHLSGPAARLAGALVGLTAFRHVTGISTQATVMTRLDLATLETSEHRYPPHRRPPAHRRTPPHRDDVADRVRRLRAAEPMSEDRFDEQVMALFESRLGMFGEVGERHYAQLPLNVAAVSVYPPHRPGRQAIGAGLDFGAARRRAARRAIEMYAWAAALSNWNGGRWRLRLAGDMTEEHRPRPPARAVGVASGFSWSAAVRTGLLAHCRDLTVGAALAAHGLFPRIDLDAVPLGAAGQTYRRLLDIVGVKFAVYDLTGELGVPVCACCRGARTVGYGVGADLPSALVDGLETVLLDHQAAVNRQHDYAPVPVPALPARRRGGLPDASPAGAGSVLTNDELVQRLRRAGREPAVVPLDDDPAIRGVLPHVVWVTGSDG